LFCRALIFFAALLGFLAAEFPNDAARAEFAIEAGVGAGATSVQAFLAVAQFMLLAVNARVPVRVKTAFIHGLIIAKRAIAPKARDN
jgi:hypothetical protein